MNNWNPWENQLRSWMPRRPSAKLRSRIFAARPAVDEPSIAFGGGWRWLAPAMGLFLWVTIVLSPRNQPIAYFAASSTNDLLATLASNHGYAYVTAAFHSKQNALDDGFQLATKPRAAFRDDSSSLLRTNSLMY